MNEDHQDALELYAQGLLGLAGGGCALTGVDPTAAICGRSTGPRG